jgi:ketosteroid isomerase-like protein
LTPTACRCGKRSGVSFDQRVFTVVTLRDGKLIQMDDFTERSQALEAAGLRE